MMTLKNIEELSFTDKCFIMEQLWESMSLDEEDRIAVPQWHQNLLDERENLLQKGKARFIDWTIAKKQIQEALT